MAKPNTTTDRPKATDVLVAVLELVIPFRYPDRDPSLSDIARLTASASRVLRYDNVDERISVENAAMLAIAKKRNLVN